MTERILNFWRRAERFPDRISLIDEKGSAWSAGSLMAEANRIAHGLQALGVRRSEVVAVLLPRCAEFVATWLAVSQIGAYLVTLNPQSLLEDLRYILSDSGARVLLIHRAAVSLKAAETLVSQPGLTSVVIGALPGHLTYAQAFGSCPATPPADRASGAVLTYTSGTTGRPKGVLRALSDTPPELALQPIARWFADAFVEPGPDGGAHLCACPLHFSGPLLYASCALHVGQTLVLMPGWNPRLALKLIEAHAITTTFMVPFHFMSLRQLPEEDRSRYSTASLRAVIHGSAPCPLEVKRAMLEWWGDVLYEVYASTEVGATIATSADWRSYPGTVGRMRNPADIRICDEHGNDLPPGQAGTIFMRVAPENEFVYKNDPEKTRAGRRGDFVTAGDVGYVNEAGYLFLLDRRADMITRRGEHIYPAQLENALAEHALVADSVVFGAPHPTWGEEIRVAIQLVPGAAPTEALAGEIKRFLRQRFAFAPQGLSVEFVSRVPRDAGGKLRRRVMKDAARQMRERHEAPTAGAD